MWLREWARDPNTRDQNLICLGDFNIDRRVSALWQAFTSTNLTVPEELESPHRLVGGKPLEHFYSDQIAWFTEEQDGSKPLLSLRYTDRAGMFDWSLTALAGSTSPHSRSPSGSPTTTRPGSSSGFRSSDEPRVSASTTLVS